MTLLDFYDDWPGVARPGSRLSLVRPCTSETENSSTTTTRSAPLSMRTPKRPDWSWLESANCQGVSPDVFAFQLGKPGTYPHEAEAKAVCWSCAVQSECLRHALTYPERTGIWGGMTPGERRRWKEASA